MHWRASAAMDVCFYYEDGQQKNGQYFATGLLSMTILLLTLFGFRYIRAAAANWRFLPTAIIGTMLQATARRRRHSGPRRYCLPANTVRRQPFRDAPLGFGQAATPYNTFRPHCSWAALLLPAFSSLLRQSTYFYVLAFNSAHFCRHMNVIDF